MVQVIGIDLGGTQLRAALMDEAGTLLRRDAVATAAAAGPQAVIAQMAGLVARVAGDDWDRVAAVGLSSPGPLNSDSGITSHLPNLAGWDGFALRAALADRLGRPVALENDGIAAANGEWHFGAGRGLTSFVYVTVSTGIGGGVVSDGRLLRGRKGMAGHIGHLTLFPGGDRCGCGNPGCFEAYACGPALLRRAKADYAAAGTVPAGLSSIEALDGRALTAAARAGDPVARGAIDREAEYLGLGFVTVLHLYSPERIVVGGGVAHALDMMLPAIRAEIERNAMPAFRDVPVVPAELGDNSGLVGAGALALTLARSSARRDAGIVGEAMSPTSRPSR